MKTFLVFSLSFLGTITLHAATLSDFQGRWHGLRTETVAGKSYIFSEKVRYWYRNDTLFAQGTITTGGRHFGIYGEYTRGGRYRAYLKQGSNIVLSHTKGNWRLMGNTISVRYSGNGISGFQYGTATLRLFNENTLISTGKSGGGTVKIVLHK